MSSPIPSTNAADALLRVGIDRSLRHPVMFFLTSGAAWLAVSIILGMASSMKMHNPTFLDGCSWFAYGRLFPAHINTFIYGWGFQAAFAAIIWLMARLSRQECRHVGTILTAGHLWNLGVSLGVVGILTGNGTGMPWMEFPFFAWPVLLVSYFAIVVWSFIQFRVRPVGHTYISQWYLLAALIWFPWVFMTANVLLHCLEGHPVMAAGINAWFKSALIFLFFTPVALGTAYYLIPKVTGRPIHSYSAALLGFWSLAAIAPWAGMQKLAGAPIPYFLPYVGAAATILLFLPAILSGYNLIRTSLGDPEIMSHSPSLRFTLTGIVGLVILGVAALFLNLTFESINTLQITQFTFSGYGFEILALYGFFSFVMFGAIYFIVPRVTRREWLSRRLIKWHFYLSIYGVISVAFAALFGGMMQGAAQENFKEPWINAVAQANPYAWFITIAWFFVLISNVFFFLHLLLMWLRLGRRSAHPTLLGGGHGTSPHGPEGDVDNTGTPAPAH
jgi:cytochrome c oxidase cbb3-type subunit I